MDSILRSWNAFYAWSMAQPVFLQVMIGLTLFFILLVAVVLIIGPIWRWISGRAK